MNVPITFRQVDSSPALQSHINALADELRREVGPVTSCRVTVAKTNQRHRHGDVFVVHVELHVPQASFNSEKTSGERDDLYATVDAAFVDLRNRLHGHYERARERRGAV